MKRIAIVTPCLERGDAVGNDVFGMYQALSEEGYDVKLFADEWEKNMDKEVRHADEIRYFLISDSDILIYHFSVGWNLGVQLVENGDYRTVIKYHNITPPQFFKGFSEVHTNVCAIGRSQLRAIARLGCDLYLSDSEYNMGELISEGANEAKNLIVPPFHHIDRLHYLKADLDFLDTYRDGKVNILMVGRLSPNKGHISLIEAFAVFYHNYNPNSRLLIVGKEDKRLESYNALLYEMVKKLGLQGAVRFIGGVSDEVLKACYLVSSTFMIASEHEGFCVPIVESMSMKLPIIAYGSSAIPDTVGKCGLVWAELDPFLMAESIDFIVRDEDLSTALGMMGWKRYQEQFTNDVIKTKFLQAIGHIL